METWVENRETCLGLAVPRQTLGASPGAVMLTQLDSRGACEMQLSSSFWAPSPP